MTTMDIVIITGASKGIGFEMMKQLKGKGKKTIGIARTNQSGEKSFITADLLKTDELPSIIDQIIEMYGGKASSFTLVNNAGMVDPIGLVGSVNPEEITNAMAVNLTAPMILSNAFIGALTSFKGKKRIMNISSGAGRNAYEGWGVYCTTKAGLDHFSRVVAKEQESAKHPVEIVSIAPGIIDTNMQETIRSSDAQSFPLLDRFIDYKEKGQLSSAEETASKLISFLEREDFKELGPIADIRNV